MQIATFAISCAALFIALGGPSWAANLVGPGKIATDAIRSRHIKDGVVRSAELADGGVHEADLAAASVSAEKVRGGAVTTTTLADGAVSGSKLGSIVVHRRDFPLAHGSVNGGFVGCGAGERLLGGGAEPNVTAGDVVIQMSFPSSSGGGRLADGQAPSGWFAEAVNNNAAFDTQVFVYAICLR